VLSRAAYYLRMISSHIDVRMECSLPARKLVQRPHLIGFIAHKEAAVVSRQILPVVQSAILKGRGSREIPRLANPGIDSAARVDVGGSSAGDSEKVFWLRHPRHLF
jgi:hypothetical protein